MNSKVMSLIVVLAAALPAAASVRTVAVMGTGSVQVVPNVASVNIQISNKGDLNLAPAALQQQNQVRVAESLPVIKELVGKSGTIQVIPSLNKTTTYNREKGEQEMTGYEAVTQIQVTLRGEAAIEQKLGALFDTSKIKADDVNLAGLGISERREAAANRVAYRKALADAQNKAEAQLEKGERLGPALARGVAGQSQQPRSKGMRAMASLEMADAGGGSAPVAQLGKISVSASTGVTFKVSGKAKRLKK